MDDILSQGPEREPGRLARHATAALVLAVLIVLAFVAVRYLPHHRAASSHHSASVVRAGPVQLAGLGPGAARMLNGDRPDRPPPLPHTRLPAHCAHIGPGNHDYQQASLFACH